MNGLGDLDSALPNPRHITHQPKQARDFYDRNPDPSRYSRRKHPSDDYYGVRSLYVHDSVLQRFLDRKQRILETGAGSGVFTEALAQAGHQIIATDISAGQVRLNRDLCKIENFKKAAVAQTDLVALPFPSASFDSVVCLGGAFSHVVGAELAAALETTRVLRPGGTFIVSVHTPVWSDDPTSPIFGESEGLRTRSYTAESLASLLRAADLNPVFFSAATLGWRGTPTGMRRIPPLGDDYLRACEQPKNLDRGVFLIAVARKS